MVMLGVTCIKIGLVTAAAAHLGWLFCGAEQGLGKDGGHGKGRGPIPSRRLAVPEEGEGTVLQLALL